MIGVYIFGFIIGAAIIGALACLSLLMYVFYDYLFPACYFCGRRIETKRILVDLSVLEFRDIGYHSLCLAYAEKTQTEVKMVAEIKERIQIKDHNLRIKKADKDYKDVERFKKKVMRSEFRDLAQEKELDCIIESNKEDTFNKQLH